MSPAEFYDVLQGAKFQIRMRLDLAAFEEFCERYILEGRDLIDN